MKKEFLVALAVLSTFVLTGCPLLIIAGLASQTCMSAREREAAKAAEKIMEVLSMVGWITGHLCSEGDFRSAAMTTANLIYADESIRSLLYEDLERIIEDLENGEATCSNIVRVYVSAYPHDMDLPEKISRHWKVATIRITVVSTKPSTPVETRVSRTSTSLMVYRNRGEEAYLAVAYEDDGLKYFPQDPVGIIEELFFKQP